MKRVPSPGSRFWNWPVTIGLGLSLSMRPLWAGDILRGRPATGGTGQTDAATAAALAVRQQLKASQQDALAKTAQSLNAFRTMQTQARQLAQQNPLANAGADPNHAGQTLPNVPNGLGAGGLQLRGAPSGALPPVQSQSGTTVNVTVKQTAQQALLEWDTFNIGRDTHLQFDQSAGGTSAAQWIAFNRVTDPSGRPSQILGKISAPGQVYVINQNGIIFGGASQVNTKTLVASSLPLNDNLVQRGLLNNPDSQFLFSALPIGAGVKGTPAFNPPPSPLADNRHGDITVQAGAQLSSPVSTDGNGGRIMLAAPNITNAGSLLAPSGQVILAAGLQVGVDAHRSSDASLRGLDVYAGSTGGYGGTVTNSGVIEVARGNASLAGKSIQHTGVIESSTSVALNGRIDIAANYDAVPNTAYDPAQSSTGSPFLFRSSGDVTLGPGSLVRILPEYANTALAPGTELALRSQVNLQGKTIHLAENATVLAPNALASLKAGTWAYNGALTPPLSVFISSGGQVYFDAGASLNVAGSAGITAPVSRVIVSLVLRSGELAPSPLQRDGFLRGRRVTVDLRDSGVYEGREWVGTPLAELRGYPGLVERSAGELTVAGGPVEISAGGSIVMQPGSGVNVSGGYIDYQGGPIQTTKLWVGGNLVDIRDATPDRVYSGILSGTFDDDHDRWGVRNTYIQALSPDGGRIEWSSPQGGDAGRIALSAPGMALDGELTGLTAPGPRQLRSSTTTGNLPRAGELALSFTGQEILNNTVVTNYPAAPDISFGSVVQQPAGPWQADAEGNPAGLFDDRRLRVFLSPQLTASRGFGSILLHNEGGNISVPEEVTLSTSAGGSFHFHGSNVSVLGSVIAPGGSLLFETLNLTPLDVAVIKNRPEAERLLPPPNAGRGIFTLGPNAVLDASGLLVDDRFVSGTAPPAAPAVIAGGSVTIDGYTASLAAGSRITVDGAALIDAGGGVHYGKGGAIAISGGQDPQLDGLTGGSLHLGATLSGLSGAQGGSLAVQAPLVQIGGTTTRSDTLLLSPEFFHTGGFTQFALSGPGARTGSGDVLPAVTVAPGTVIQPRVTTLQVETLSTDEGIAVRTLDLPAGVRAPVSVSLAAPGIRDGILDSPLVRGDLVLGAGSLIETDPRGTVTLSGKTITALGSVIAPGGSISLLASTRSADAFPGTEQALTTLYTGPESLFSAAGTTVLLPDPYGRRTGSVLNGGTVSLTGNLFAAPGTRVDVSGTSGELDVAPSVARPLRDYSLPGNSGTTGGPGSLAVERVRVDSDGGTIHVRGGEFLFSGAALEGRAGGPAASGGTLQVSSGRYYPPGTVTVPPTDTNLVVTQSDAGLPPLPPAGTGAPVAGPVSRGYFSTGAFTSGGFDSLTLGGVVEFQGPVNLSARAALRIADGGVLHANDAVQLSAPYVAIGQAFAAPVRPEDRTNPLGTGFAPSFGSGSLTVSSGHIDLGTLSLQNTGRATLTASHGDIRGSGVFNIAGDLTLRAGQIYPVTASPLEIFAYDYVSSGSTKQGSITVEAAGTRPLPLSAGGTLGLYAGRIVQRGTLRAPFGSITPGWDGTGTAPRNLIAGTTAAAPVTTELLLAAGSTTSVSGIDPLTGKGVTLPYGISTDGLSWIDPRGVDITAGGLPQKSITLSGLHVSTAAGATLDLRGGGELLAYRWVEGNGGPEDILAPPGSFAIVPGDQSPVAAAAPYNSSTADTNLISAYGPGYVNSALRAGDQIYVEGSGTLAAGTYTLLPARYALLPGAVLVTPRTAEATGTWELPDGSSLVSGYRFNGLDTGRAASTLASQFELASGPVVRQRAQYETHLANAFLSTAATRLNLALPLLPRDSGALAFQASQSLQVLGPVLSPSASGGRGARIDLSSSLDFLINRTGESSGTGGITLSSATLQSWGAESLVIGGRRTLDTSGNTVLDVTSRSITLDNAGAPLTAADVTLAARGTVTLAPGAELASTGGAAHAGSWRVSGNGALIRVSADPEAAVIRTGAGSAQASLSAGTGAKIAGGSVTLDSTAATSLDPSVQLHAQSYTVNSGRISLVLDHPGTLASDPGLVLTSQALAGLQDGDSLSLRSYSSLDLYGSGSIGGADFTRLSLHAGEIRSLTPGENAVTFAAREIQLGNSAGAPGVPVTPSALPEPGSLGFQAEIIRFTEGNLAVNGTGSVNLSATRGITGEGAGRFIAQDGLTIRTPLLTGAAGSNRALMTGGDLVLTRSGDSSTLTPGLGATLELSGRQTTLAGTVVLPGGSLSAAAAAGPLTVNGRLDVSGVARTFYDVTRYTDAGTIDLSAAGGDVRLGASSVVSVAAAPGGGNAGALHVSVPEGAFISGGTLAGSGGRGGSFQLDTLALADTSSLSAILTGAGLTAQQAIRVRSGDVVLAGTAAARSFSLGADAGSITVTGTIDASGTTGGHIHLAAREDLTVASGARLTVAGQDFDNAGKGGQITLEAGAQRDGVTGSGTLDLQSGATLDLSVTGGNAGSAAPGNFTGKLHLRAPQNTAGTDIAVTALNSTILNASSILMEGYRLYDLSVDGGAITAAVQNTIRNDGITFPGAAGSASAASTAVTARLLENNATLAPVFVLAPGAEIINSRGNLTLGDAGTTTLNDWDLSSWRFGEKSAAGILTLRASGDLIFNNTLSDGFTPYVPANNPPPVELQLWQGRLMAPNPLLPANAQSWSYRLTAGADLTAAGFSGTAGGSTGSVQLGKAGFTQEEQNNTVAGGNTADIRSVIPQRWQVIRTGSGDISISAAGSIQLLNQLTAIYTAGTAVADATMGGTFDLPRPGQPATNPGLGAAQLSTLYPAQYSLGGGNISLHAGANIEHLTRDASGALVADSGLQLPSNWLYRRGTVDSATGRFGEGRANGEVLSTSWWVDFNNFYEGVGALGGGNVSLTAAGSISNVDAVAPTSLRVTKGTADNPLAVSQSALELGGGDVTVRAGANIDAGVYYVERGNGTLAAGGSILTNATRSVLSPSSIAAGQGSPLSELPATLFAGRAHFDVTARGDVLLGSVANPFLLPQGLGNSVWYKSFFSSYGASSSVTVSSLGGDVTLRAQARPFGEGAGTADPLLYLWALNKQFLGPNSASFAKPWLRLNDVAAENARFRTLTTLQPGTLDVSAWSGDINVTGSFTLSPSATGNLTFLAAGAINALQPTGTVNINGLRTTWGVSTINVSDANPLDIPGWFNPLGYTNAMAQAVNARQPLFFQGLDALFTETGSGNGVLQTKQALHAPGLLHLNDPQPLRLYAGTGDIAGLTLYSPKAARIFAGRDLTDASLYIQNVKGGDLSIVTSGRDIIPANAGAPLRVEANRTGNVPHPDAGPLAGDIQISGPGTLQVLAGRTIDLGTVDGNAGGTGTGITSTGNGRNPSLPFSGANLIVAAGMGASPLNPDAFITAYVLTAKGAEYLKELAPQMGGRTFEQLDAEEQKRIAIEVFHLVLRDTGRQHLQTPGDEYAAGYAAIATLFPGTAAGEIFTRGRDIRTRTGGNISLLIPGGGLTLANTAIGNPLAPPGIVTESGGNISIFAKEDVSVGIGRIFTLRGGNEIIWSSRGDIAAGSSARTVLSAPPTRVLIDPQSGAVQTDLAGLATGGGIGVLATVAGVKPGDVDLIAPEGVVDAGDAGIRSSGNLTIAAAQVINAGNISAGGTSSGTPAPVSAPGIGSLTSASNAAAAGNAAASATAAGHSEKAAPTTSQPLPSIVSVEVLAYGGGEEEAPPEEESEEEKRRRREAGQEEAPEPPATD